MDKITLTPEETGEAIDFFVLEQTRVAGKTYILVTDKEEGDGNALILKDMSDEESSEGLFEIVSEETELDAISKIFEEILDDIEFEN